MAANRVHNLAKQLTRSCTSNTDRAIRIHDFVRDEVEFGFTRRFNTASAQQVLDNGIGHGVPKTTLLVEMLAAVDIRAFQHAVVTDKSLLRGILAEAWYPMANNNLLHCYAEIELGNQWLHVDSHTVDLPLANAARKQLAMEGLRKGYGIDINGQSEWDGKHHSFIQLVNQSDIQEDHGIISHCRDLNGFAQRRANQRLVQHNRLFHSSHLRQQGNWERQINLGLHRFRYPLRLVG